MPAVRALVASIAIAIAGCGKPPRDALLAAPVPGAATGPPHEAVYVTGKRGLLRVFLDSGEAEVIDPEPGAVLGAGGATVHRRKRGFVVVRDGKAIEVDGVTSDDRPVL